MPQLLLTSKRDRCGKSTSDAGTLPFRLLSQREISRRVAQEDRVVGTKPGDRCKDVIEMQGKQVVYSTASMW